MLSKLELFAEILDGERSRFVALLVKEVFKPLRDAEAEFDFARNLLDASMKLFAPEVEGGSYRVCFRPKGRVAIITPWNNPVAIPIGKLVPALAYGNQVIWKPSERSEQISNLIYSCLVKAGLAEHLELRCGGSDVGREVIQTESLDAVSFTGSVVTGQAIRNELGVRVAFQAELGGSNAAIICADMLPETVAKTVVPAAFSFSGQRCTAIRRVIVERPLASALCDALCAEIDKLKLGDPALCTTDIGPLICEVECERILSHIQQSTLKGASVLRGGGRPQGFMGKNWLEPTLVLNPPLRDHLIMDEVFGPILSVIVVEDFSEALVRCNETNMGLLAALFTQDMVKQHQFLQQAQAGILVLNNARPAFHSEAPFFGWKDSGDGMPEHGRWDRDFYSKVQVIYE